MSWHRHGRSETCLRDSRRSAINKGIIVAIVAAAAGGIWWFTRSRVSAQPDNPPGPPVPATYYVSLGLQPANGGNVEVLNDVPLERGKQVQVVDGTGITVRAVASPGYRFVRWNVSNYGHEFPVADVENTELFVMVSAETMKWSNTLHIGAVFTTLTPEPTGMFGDGNVDGDGIITEADVTMMLRAISKQIVLTDAQWLSADVNGDGKVDTLDARLLDNYRVGKSPSLPGGQTPPRA